jgi:hypothetical protein
MILQDGLVIAHVLYLVVKRPRTCRMVIAQGQILSRGVHIIPSSLISEDLCNECSLWIIPLGFLT